MGRGGITLGLKKWCRKGKDRDEVFGVGGEANKNGKRGKRIIKTVSSVVKKAYPVRILDIKLD